MSITFHEGSVCALSKAHGAIRQPQLLLRQQEHMCIQTKLCCYRVTHLRNSTKPAGVYASCIFIGIDRIRWTCCYIIVDL